MPGLAGQYQAEGATAALIAELGDNYPVYHAYLAVQLAAFGGRPSIGDFPDKDSYFTAWQRIQDILMAEAFCRSCRSYRLNGDTLGDPLDTSIPLVATPDDHLVSAVLRDF